MFSQVQPGAVSVLPEGPPGQLQPQAARLPRPQHEVRPVPEEGEIGQVKGPEGGPGPWGGSAQVFTQLGTKYSWIRHPRSSPPYSLPWLLSAFCCRFFSRKVILGTYVAMNFMVQRVPYRCTTVRCSV